MTESGAKRRFGCRHRFLAALIAGSMAIPAGAAVQVHPQIARALGRLYNFDFAGSHAILDARIAERPDEPLAYVFRAAVYLFYELDRLEILESEFFKDDAKIRDRSDPDPDPVVRERLMNALERARELAEARLVEDPDDTEALFALCLREGLLTDYYGLIEKRGLKSFARARAANQHAQRLLELEPAFYDAYLTSGVNEYLLGSLPFLIRWLVPMEGIKGNKGRAFERLELVAQRGAYLGPFARILMSIMSLREGRPERARLLLARLAREYPENPLIRKELQKVTERIQSGELRSAD